MAGIVYLLINEAMPGLVKIGKTTSPLYSGRRDDVMADMGNPLRSGRN